MQVAVDISLYPLDADYIPPIKDVIARLNRHPDISVVTNPMATQLRGDYDVVMDVLGEDSLWMALANESNKSASRNWSVTQAVQYAESVAAGAVKILDVAHMMDEIEARLIEEILERLATELVHVARPPLW